MSTHCTHDIFNKLMQVKILLIENVVVTMCICKIQFKDKLWQKRHFTKVRVSFLWRKKGDLKPWHDRHKNVKKYSNTIYYKTIINRGNLRAFYWGFFITPH